MTPLKIHIVILAICIILYLALTVYNHYSRAKLLKEYSLAGIFISLLEALILISTAYTAADSFGPGMPCGMGWWFLYFGIGLVLIFILKPTIGTICQKIWPEDESVTPTVVKIPNWVSIAGRIFAIVVCIAFAFFFAYGVIASGEINTIASAIVAILLALLCIYGIVFNSKELIKLIKDNKDRNR